jgi:uncharacterized protein (UPF0548 family)
VGNSSHDVDLGRLESLDLTYPERAATSTTLPPGYRHLYRQATIGYGEATFDRAGDALTGWRMHRAAGLVVHASQPRATTGTVLLIRFGGRSFGVSAPCRVVYTIDEATRKGFAYGTLPGHPECGEEAFVLSLTGDGRVRLDIRAFSRPATVLARVGGPVSRWIQDLVTTRYVRAICQLSVEKLN